jgi:hypothetical protein
MMSLPFIVSMFSTLWVFIFKNLSTLNDSKDNHLQESAQPGHPDSQGPVFTPSFTPLYCLEEWRGEQRISPLGDNFTPRGQSSLLGDNFAPGGESLGVKLRMGLSGGFLKMKLRRSSKFEHSLGRSVIENVLKSWANKLAYVART